MRYVTALFDAPIPARHALGALRGAGFEARDIACIPALSDRPEDGGLLDMTAESFAGLGLPSAFTELALEGLQRGAVLICLRAPELSAEHAARLLDEAGAQAPEALARDWAAEPGLRYEWRALPPPRVEGLEPAPDPAVQMEMDDPDHSPDAAIETMMDDPRAEADMSEFEPEPESDADFEAGDRSGPLDAPGPRP